MVVISALHTCLVQRFHDLGSNGIWLYDLGMTYDRYMYTCIYIYIHMHGPGSLVVICNTFQRNKGVGETMYADLDSQRFP